MGYRDDYNEIFNRNEKIPYDDTPISREGDSKKPKFIFHKSSSSEGASSKFKFLVGLVALMFCLNIILIGTFIYNLKNGGKKYVTIQEISATVSGDNLSVASVQKARFSSVCIAAGGNIHDEYSFFHNSNSTGSGVILEKNEKEIYILTCQHIIDGNESKVYVQFPSLLNPIKASIVGTSKKYDIAVLKVTDVNKIDASFAIEVYDSQLLSYGEQVFAVGNSFSGGISVTSGDISRINVLIDADGYSSRVLQTSAAVNPGNSGGGLFNAEGKFIGLNNAKLFSKKNGSNMVDAEGMAYAIPSTLAVGIAKNIIASNGSPSNIYLGVVFENDSNSEHGTELIDGKFVDNYRVVVSSVQSATIANGKLKSGDEVVSFTYLSLNGERKTIQMYNKYCFEDISFDIKVNSTIEFLINRVIPNEEGKIIRIEATNTIVQY